MGVVRFIFFETVGFVFTVPSDWLPGGAFGLLPLAVVPLRRFGVPGICRAFCRAIVIILIAGLVGRARGRVSSRRVFLFDGLFIITLSFASGGKESWCSRVSLVLFLFKARNRTERFRVTACAGEFVSSGNLLFDYGGGQRLWLDS